MPVLRKPPIEPTRLRGKLLEHKKPLKTSFSESESRLRGKALDKIKRLKLVCETKPEFDSLCVLGRVMESDTRIYVVEAIDFPKKGAVRLKYTFKEGSSGMSITMNTSLERLWEYVQKGEVFILNEIR